MINAFLEAVKAEPMNPSRIIMYARNAADEIEELRNLCQTYFHEGSDSLTRQDIERIEGRIREIVG